MIDKGGIQNTMYWLCRVSNHVLDDPRAFPMAARDERGLEPRLDDAVLQ